MLDNKILNSDKLNNIQTKRLVTHSDDRGFLFEVLRSDDAMYKEFGQVYINYTDPGVIKAFHSHKESEDNFACLSGRIRLVVLDEKTEEVRMFYLGPEQNLLVNIPTNLMHGWQCLGNERAMVLNVASKAYNKDKPDETRVSPDAFPWFSWEIVNK